MSNDYSTTTANEILRHAKEATRSDQGQSEIGEIRNFIREQEKILSRLEQWTERLRIALLPVSEDVPTDGPVEGLLPKSKAAESQVGGMLDSHNQALIHVAECIEAIRNKLRI